REWPQWREVQTDRIPDLKPCAERSASWSWRARSQGSGRLLRALEPFLRAEARAILADRSGRPKDVLRAGEPRLSSSRELYYLRAVPGLRGLRSEEPSRLIVSRSAARTTPKVCRGISLDSSRLLQPRLRRCGRSRFRLSLLVGSLQLCGASRSTRTGFQATELAFKLTYLLRISIIKLTTLRDMLNCFTLMRSSA